MNVAIVGATGYGGIQAVNLLKKNKKYKISFLGGNKTSGSKWNDNFPFIYLDNDPYIEEISVDNISKNADVALLCLPNGLSSTCLLYTSPSPRDRQKSRMPSSA